MRSLEITAEGESRGQAANPGSRGKWLLKLSLSVCVCVCVCVSQCKVTAAAGEVIMVSWCSLTAL